MNSGAKVGGPDRDRTGDLMNAIHARSQLRYWPTLGKNSNSSMGIFLRSAGWLPTLGIRASIPDTLGENLFHANWKIVAHVEDRNMAVRHTDGNRRSIQVRMAAFGWKITSMFPAAASRLSDRALEFFRRGEKNRSSAFHRTQIERTTEFAL
jgi:hypothetical protein